MSWRRKGSETLLSGFCLCATSQKGILEEMKIHATSPMLSRFICQNRNFMGGILNGKRGSSHDMTRWLSTEVIQGTGRQGTKKSWMYNSLLLLPPAIAAYLGTWQMERREGKIKMLEQRQTMVKVSMYVWVGLFFFFERETLHPILFAFSFFFLLHAYIFFLLFLLFIGKSNRCIQ